MMGDHTLHETTTEETPCTESIVKTISTQQEPSTSNDLSNVIINLPPIINQPVHFPNVSSQSVESAGNVELEEDQADKALFFNYHEFQDTYYIDVESVDKGPKEHDKDHALVITHFPNIYVPVTSSQWEETRIVRIPRSYDQRVNYPCFSEYLPGSEPAAITNDISGNKFICQGKIPRDGQWYGYSSVSPLSNYFTASQFKTIVSQINSLIEEEYKIGSFTNIMDMCLGFVTLGIYSWINNRFTTHPTKVDQYITRLNNSPRFKHCGVAIIPLTRSGYLSLDFQVPTPSLSLGN